MGSKHTAGPWSVRREGGYYHVHSTRGGRLATMSIHENREELKANAKLLAAAPTMFHAIKLLKHGIENMIKLNEHNQKASFGYTSREALETVNWVIEQIEGVEK